MHGENLKLEIKRVYCAVLSELYLLNKRDYISSL